MKFAISSLMLLLIVVGSGGCTKEETITSGGSNDWDLSDPAIMPVVTSTYPRTNTVGPFNLYDRGDGSYKAHFLVTFNKLIYKYSVTPKSILLTGFDRPVIARIQSYYYYYGRGDSKSSAVNSEYYYNVLSFTIADSFSYYSPVIYRIGQVYTITLDTTIEDINGNHLSNKYSFSFTPEPYFRVVSMYPMNASSDVPIYHTPQITFNGPINQNTLANIHITPQPSGKWVWNAYDSLSAGYQIGQQYFPFNTSYTLTVSSTAQDANSHLIDRMYTSAYTTIPFKVVQNSPLQGSTGNFLGTSINFSMSGPIDTSTVRSALTISPSTPGRIDMYPNSTFLSFSPSNGLRQTTQYSVSLGASLKSADGSAIAPFTLTFTTDQFRVSSTYPNDGQTNVSRYNDISIYTNAQLEGASATASFSISPTVAYNVYATDGYSGFYIAHNQFAANTNYTVTISTALRTKAGDNLPSAYTFSFTTGAN